ncbi:MAG: hypothetical protein EOP50_06710 [Sphingobacteriales bacterium]|nr:MAG: hypothetical protein EOP50_06710 [Sphingobacteriales bacterium]
MKQASILVLATLLAAGVQAQTKDKVDKAAQQPDRATQSGRADVWVQDKTRISDDSTAQVTPPKKKAAHKKGRCTRKHGK